MTQPSDNKRIIRNTLMLYLRMFVILGVTLYTSRVVLEQLGVVDYGIYNVVGGVVFVLGLFNGTMSAAPQRFLAVAVAGNSKDEIKKVFCTACSLHLIFAGFVALLAETVGLWFLYRYINIPSGDYSAALWVYQCTICTAILSIMIVPFTSMSIAHENMSIYAYISFFEAFLKLGVAFLLILITVQKLKLYALLVMLSTLIVLVTWMVYTNKKYSYLRYKILYKKDIAKELFSFIGWQTLGSFAWIARTQGVNIVLNIFFGPVLNAARGIAVQVNTALSQFVQNFQLAVVPQINKHYALDERDDMNSLIMTSSKISFLLMFVLALPVLMETRPILTLWLKNVPDYGVIFVQLMILTTLTDFMSGTLGSGALATGRIKYYWIVISSVFLLDLPLVYMAYILKCAPETMFYVEMSLNAICLLLRLRFVRYLTGFPMWIFLKSITSREIAVMVLSFLGAVCFKRLLPETLAGIISVIIVSFIIAALFTCYIGLNKKERLWLTSVVKQKLHLN